MKLSIAMIVKNEEKNIERCLKSFSEIQKKIKSEIIVVDTGSEDKTVELAKKYTSKVFIHQWDGNFANMRNISISYCKGDWILIVDADEVLENVEAIWRFIESKESKQVNSASVVFKNYSSDNDEKYILGCLFRLFRNKSKIEYVGRVHEQPKIVLPAYNTDIIFKHYGYSRSNYKLMQYKYERNRDLLLLDLQSNPNDEYTLFQLAQTYSMANYEDEALEYIEKAYKILQTKDYLALYIYHFYARTLMANKSYLKVIEICERAFEKGAKNLDFYYLLGKAYEFECDYINAIKYLEGYFEVRDEMKKDIKKLDNTIVSYSYSIEQQVIVEIAMVYFREQKYEKIIKMFKSNICNDNTREKIKELYFYSSMYYENSENILEYYEGKKLTESDVENLINDIKKARRDFEEFNYKDFSMKISTLDNRLKLYFKNLYDGGISDSEFEQIDLENYCNWKGDIFNYILKTDYIYLNKLLELKFDDIISYINYAISDYYNLEKCIQYTENAFLCRDIRNLNLVCIIEDLLIRNNSIEGEIYEKIFYRTLINRKSFIKRYYSSEIYDVEFVNIINNRVDRFYVNLYKILESLQSNKLKAIKELKQLLQNHSEYALVLDYIKENLIEDEISNDMRKEKSNICNIVEQMINEGRLEEVEDILKELNNTFKLDNKILMLKGILSYMKGELSEAILFFARAIDIEEGNFDANYNLAVILEECGKKETCKEYYSKAIECTGIDSEKENIKAIIKSIKK